MKSTRRVRNYWLEAIIDYSDVTFFYDDLEELNADVEFYKSNPACILIEWGELGAGNSWGNVWKRYPDK